MSDFSTFSEPKFDPLLEQIAKRWLQPACRLARISYALTAPPRTAGAASLQEHQFCHHERRSKTGALLCLASHRNLRSVAAGGQPSEMVCHNGRWACAVPIMAGPKACGIIEVGGVSTSSPGSSLDKNAESGPGRPSGAADRASQPCFPPEDLPMILQLLQNIAGVISQEAENAIIARSDRAPSPVHYAQSQIQKRFPERISLAIIAREVSLCEDHFSKLFKRATGQAFTEYVTGVRIAHARKLLVSSSHRISEVAFESGFESLPHFNRMFKRITGKSPTAFRNGCGNSPPIYRGN